MKLVYLTEGLNFIKVKRKLYYKNIPKNQRVLFYNSLFCLEIYRYQKNKDRNSTDSKIYIHLKKHLH